MFTPRYLPCPECGESVARRAEVPHNCDARRKVDYLMFGMRDDIAALEERFRVFVNSPAGRFEAWAAARHVGRAS